MIEIIVVLVLAFRVNVVCNISSFDSDVIDGGAVCSPNSGRGNSSCGGVINESAKGFESC